LKKLKQSEILSKAIKVLEFDKVLEKTSNFAKGLPGKEKVLSLLPKTEIETVKENLSKTNFFCNLHLRGGIPIRSYPDLRPLFKKVRIEGSVLSEKEIAEVIQLLSVGKELAGFFTAFPLEGKLSGIFNFLSPSEGLLKEILKFVDEKGQVIDSASSELLKIRTSIRRISSEIRRKLEVYFSKYSEVLRERVITERNSRYVILAKPNFRKSFEGIVHDVSGSGESFYVEPIGILEDNNRLEELRGREKKEVRKILKKLTEFLRNNVRELERIFWTVVEIDFWQAVARFSLEIEGVVPEFCEEVSLIQAKHPILLLSNQKVVGVDIRFKNGLVITGPNAGGKTVALKTVGLFSLMAQSGFLVPAQKCKLKLFKRWLVDIGDEQSIEQSLSTFSAHAVNLAGILKHADESSLVLIDELGTGTDPVEGSALAVAILKDLERKKSTVVITTHLGPVKMFAWKSGYYEVATVLFDERTLKPLYELAYGIIGKSYALEVARICGIPEDVIREAKRNLVGGESDIMELLEREYLKLQEEKAELARLKEQLVEREKELEELKEQLESALKKSQKKKEFKQLVKKVEKSVKLLQEETSPINVGDVVEIRGKKGKGRVVSVDKEKGIAEVVFGSLRFKTKLRELKKSEPVPVADDGVYHAKPKKFKPEIMLRGMTREEALLALEKFINDALLVGAKRVRIIHGLGEGILKRAVREYLTSLPFVKSFRSGDAYEGGEGVTVVEFE